MSHLPSERFNEFDRIFKVVAGATGFIAMVLMSSMLADVITGGGARINPVDAPFLIFTDLVSMVMNYGLIGGLAVMLYVGTMMRSASRLLWLAGVTLGVCALLPYFDGTVLFLAMSLAIGAIVVVMILTLFNRSNIGFAKYRKVPDAPEDIQQPRAATIQDSMGENRP
ncbi:MAG TPA: hypothetical protein VMR98_00265 [Candidatus Polarisedimenticolaceae bacterium]|nr:hypothetical protein [Candidatus Polarisedimenticolaceae bacterium]